MIDKLFRLTQTECTKVLKERLNEPAPGRIQLLSGPRQVGKTETLLGLIKKFKKNSIYTAADSPESSLPGYWERIWHNVYELEKKQGLAILFIDEIQHIEDWSLKLKGEWDKIKKDNIKIHIVVSGSSSLLLGLGSKESLAGRIERITLSHWSAAMIKKAFKISKDEAVMRYVNFGSYPGSMAYIKDLPRWSAYIRDAIIEPAISRDIFSLSDVRRPALLKQVFALSLSCPAQIISLNKLQGQLQDKGALDTISQYLSLLEESYLVAALEKYASRPIRKRSSPPKLITLNNALLAAVSPKGIPNIKKEPDRFGFWLENACLAHAYNSGQKVSYWREEPLEVDGILEGSWGNWAIEIKSSSFVASDLKGLFEFTANYPSFTPLIVCDQQDVYAAKKYGILAMSWQNFLFSGPRLH